jgi:hypothetical protein
MKSLSRQITSPCVSEFSARRAWRPAWGQRKCRLEVLRNSLPFGEAATQLALGAVLVLGEGLVLALAMVLAVVLVLVLAVVPGVVRGLVLGWSLGLSGFHYAFVRVAVVLFP